MSTLQDVAQRAGVSLGTASTALNGRASVRASTRERVEKAAAELGYRKDAAASVLAGKQRRSTAVRKQMSLGYVESPGATDTADSWKVFSAEARRLGYDSEQIKLGSYRSTKRALEHLRFLNVQGLYLSSPGAVPNRDWLDFGWGHFSVVKGFRAWPELTVPVIRHNAFDYMGVTRDHVIAEGYQRIAVILTRSTVPYDDQARLGALLAYSQLEPDVKVDIEWFVLDEPCKTAPLPLKLRQWLRKIKPEVVIAFPGSTIYLLRSSGFRIPEDFAFAAVIQDGKLAAHMGTAGCDRRAEAFPRRAVELLHRMVQVGDRGLHEEPVEAVVEPQWQEGASLPPRVRGIPKR